MDDLEIDGALRSALSVTPSPEFVARVRTKIAEAPRPAIVAGWLRPAVAAACAAVVVITVGLNPHHSQDASATAGLKPSTTTAPIDTTTAPTPRIQAVVVPTFRSAKSAKPTAGAHVPLATEPPLPEVIIAAGDVEALRQLLVSLNERTFVASFEETPVSTPWVMTSLSVAPIGGDPLDPPPAHNN